MSDYGDITVDIIAEQAKANDVVQAINKIDAEKTKLDETRSQAIAQLNAHQGVLQFLLGKMPEDERRAFIEELNSANAPQSPTSIEKSVQDDS